MLIYHGIIIEGDFTFNRGKYTGMVSIETYTLLSEIDHIMSSDLINFYPGRVVSLAGLTAKAAKKCTSLRLLIRAFRKETVLFKFIPSKATIDCAIIERININKPGASEFSVETFPNKQWSEPLPSECNQSGSVSKIATSMNDVYNGLKIANIYMHGINSKILMYMVHSKILIERTIDAQTMYNLRERPTFLSNFESVGEYRMLRYSRINGLEIFPLLPNSYDGNKLCLGYNLDPLQQPDIENKMTQLFRNIENARICNQQAAEEILAVKIDLQRRESNRYTPYTPRYPSNHGKANIRIHA